MAKLNKKNKSLHSSESSAKNLQEPKRDMRKKINKLKKKSLSIENLTNDQFDNNNNDITESCSANQSSSSTITEISFDKDEYDIYRVGDWVYCEFETDQPYSIRKIEEFTKSAEGNIEAKLRCAFRRNDISPSLLSIVEKRFSQYFTSIQSTLSFSSLKSDLTDDFINSDLDKDEDTQFYLFIQNLSHQDIALLKQRELFYSRYSESNVSIKILRGKLTLNLFMPDIHSFNDYLNTTQDKFFYQIVYDPNQKMLSADKNEIRIGSKYQADVPDFVTCSNDYPDFETLVWDGPESCKTLKDVSIKKYYNRVIDFKLEKNERNFKNCEIIQTRDSLMYDSLRHLHLSSYNKNKALSTFDFKSVNDFDKANDSKLWIEDDMLPTKSFQSIIEYYYNIWKISDDYIEKRDEKRLIKKSQLNEITVPKFLFLTTSDQTESNESSKILCQSCQKLQSSNLFNRNPFNFTHFRSDTSLTNSCTNLSQEKSDTDLRLGFSNEKNRSDIFSNSRLVQYNNHSSSNRHKCPNENLCNQCWIYWKKFGAFKSDFDSVNGPSRPEKRQERLNAIRSQTHKCTIDQCFREFEKISKLKKHTITAHCLIIKKALAPQEFKEIPKFVLKTTQLTKIARRVYSRKNPNYFKRLARNPVKLEVNLNDVKTDFDPKKYTQISIKKKKKNLDKILDKLNYLNEVSDENFESLRPLTPLSDFNEDESNKSNSLSKQIVLSVKCLNEKVENVNRLKKNQEYLSTEEDCIIVSSTPSPTQSPSSSIKSNSSMNSNNLFNIDQNSQNDQSSNKKKRRLNIEFANETIDLNSIEKNEHLLYYLCNLLLNNTGELSKQELNLIRSICRNETEYNYLIDLIFKIDQSKKTLTKLFGFNKYDDWCFRPSQFLKTKRVRMIQRKDLKKLARGSFKYPNFNLFKLLETKAMSQQHCFTTENHDQHETLKRKHLHSLDKKRAKHS